jgi:energy-coupling factor transporter transmembrane protein EcfT
VVVGFLESLENTGISLFIRESDSLLSFPTILTTHAFAYTFIMGTNAIVSARMLGFAKSIPIKPLRRLFPVMWLGLIVTTLTGLALTMAAAQKRVPNPILWFKMALLLVAAPMMWKFQKKVFDDPSVNENNIPPSARTMAAWQLALWILIMISGRLIPYSGTILGDGY